MTISDQQVETAEKLQSLLSSCDKEDFAYIKQEIDIILNSANEDIQNLFIRTFFNILPARYRYMDKLAHIIATIGISSNEQFKTKFLSDLEERTKQSNNEIVTSFLCDLMHIDYITPVQLMELLLRDFEYSHKLTNDVFNQIIMLVARCSSELNQANHDMLESIYTHIENRKHVISSGLFEDENAPIFEDFFGYLTTIKTNHWSIPNDFPLKRLIDAIQSDNQNTLQSLISQGEYELDYQLDPSILIPPPILGFSPSIASVCAFFGAINCFQMLCNDGCDLTIEDDEGRSVMQFAIAGGNMNIVQLIDSKIGTNIQGCFQVSVEFIQPEIFDFLRTKEPNLCYGLEESVDCPLHAAVKVNSVYFTKLLLKEHVPISSRDDYNWTPLHIAASYNSIEALTLLVSYHNNNSGIDPNIGDLDGDTPLHCAAKEGFVECIRILMSQNGIKPDAHDRHGATPLHYAACYDKDQAINELLSSPDVPPNTMDAFNRTALQLAAVSGCSKSAAALARDPRVDPNTFDLERSNALFSAVNYGEVSIVKAVCECPTINLNARNKNNLTAVEEAAFHNKLDIVKFLVSKGADISGLKQAQNDLPDEVKSYVQSL